jgi:DNA-directed RNA polymerase I, II, and III subunit RPABC2
MSYFGGDDSDNDSYIGGAGDDDSDVESIAPVVKRSNATINFIEEDEDEEVISEAGEESDVEEAGEEVEASDVEEEAEASDVEEVVDDEDIEIDEDGEPIIKKSVASSKRVKELPKNLVYNINEDDDKEEDEDDETGEQYLQKFDKEVNKNYIMDFHPECVLHNYDEISALTNVIRDKNNVIIDPLHKTIPFLTKYEKARILGQRAKQINSGATPFVKVPENVIDGYLIAELELAEKRIPFIIRRPLPNGGSEYWNIKDLEIIGF